MALGVFNMFLVWKYILTGNIHVMSEEKIKKKALWSVFEPTCADARWAHMHHFPSVRLSTYVQRPIYFRLRPISVVIDFDYDPL